MKKKSIFHFFTFDEPSHSVIHRNVCKHPKYAYCHGGYLRQWQITASAHTENAAPRGIVGLWGHWSGRDCPTFLFDVGPRCEPTGVFPQLFGEGGAPCAEGFKRVLRWYCGRTSANDTQSDTPPTALVSTSWSLTIPWKWSWTVQLTKTGTRAQRGPWAACW